MVSETTFQPTEWDGTKHGTSLPQEDWAKILEWNQDLPLPTPSCVHDLIDQHVRIQPQALAVHAWDGALSYGELHELASRLGRYLVSIGVDTEMFVPLCFEKSVWAVVSMLAVLKAGAASVFLDPSHPTERKRHIAHEVGARLVLSSRNAKPEAEITAPILQVDRAFVATIREDSLPKLPQVQPNSAAVALFTSGSTGKPKGIVQQHSTAAFSAQNCARLFDISSDSRVLQWAAYCFDMSVIDILMTLVAGACLCIPSEQERMNDLVNVITSMKITVAAMTPSVAKTLKSVHLPELKTLVFGGESVSREHLEGWSNTLRIINAYGPAEGSASKDKVCVVGEALPHSPSNIGKAAGSVVWLAYEMDPTVLAPIGTIGEILIEGPLLAKGYLHDPAKTSLAFLEDMPWLLRARGKDRYPRRLYRSGDLARYAKDGSIEFLGRKDTQIKLRGQRIEVEEIEHHIRQYFHGDFAVAVDVIHPADGPATAQLTAFIAPERKPTSVKPKEGDLLSVGLSTSEALLSQLLGLNDKLAKSLPAYMIPSYDIPLTHIPLTSAGKIDRKRLRSLGSGMTTRALSNLLCGTVPHGSVTHLDRTGAERQMAELWAKVLSVRPETIGSSDNFFKLGGDSISAMKVVGLAKDCKLRLTTKQMFQHPTLTAISFVVFGGQVSNEDIAMKPAIGGNIDTSAAIAQKQEIQAIEGSPDIQAYMISCGLLKSHGYITFFAFDFDGHCDSAQLDRSCRMLVQHHEILRTTFRLQSGRIQQVVLGTYNTEVVHISSDESTPTLLKNLCRTETTSVNNLEDSILRFVLVQGEHDRTTLILRISHAQFDGTSLHILYRDLKSIYEGQLLPPAPQYIDFARAVQEANNSEAEAFWRSLLHGSSMTHIVRHTKPSYAHVINTTISLQVPAPTSIQQIHGITLATLVKSAWASVLSRMSRTSDVVFGYAVTGRNLPVPGIESIVGDCNNAALARIDLSPTTSPTVLSLLHQVQNQAASAIPYENVGVRQMVEKCTDWPRWTRYSSSVNHQNYTNAGDNEFRIGAARCTVTYRDLEADRRDVQVYSSPPDPDGMMKLQMAFCDGAIEKSVVEDMLAALGETVGRFAGDVQAPLLLPADASHNHNNNNYHSKTANTTTINLPIIPLTPKTDQRSHAFRSSNNNNKTQSEEEYAYPTIIRLQTFRFTFLDPDALVDRVWTKLLACFPPPILYSSSPSSSSSSTSSPKATDAIGENEPFYNIGGDLVYAAQLSEYYLEEGIGFAMEDLLEWPTKREQREVVRRGIGMVGK